MLMAEKNERSRAHARAALEAYRAAHTPAADGSPRTADPDDLAAIGDLIADLLHLADELDPGDGMHTFGGANSQLAYTALTAYEHEADPANANESC